MRVLNKKLIGIGITFIILPLAETCIYLAKLLGLVLFVQPTVKLTQAFGKSAKKRRYLETAQRSSLLGMRVNEKFLIHQRFAK